MMIHLNKLISRFVKDYRTKIRPDLEQNKTDLLMREHCFAGRIAWGFDKEHSFFDYIDLKGASPDVGGRYLVSIFVLLGLYEDLKNSEELDKAFLLELDRNISEIEFLLSDDPYYKEIVGLN